MNRLRGSAYPAERLRSLGLAVETETREDEHPDRGPPPGELRRGQSSQGL